MIRNLICILPFVVYATCSFAQCTANFSYKFAEPLLVKFHDLSKGAVKWEWDFGDGKESDKQNPEHKYDTAGKYTVCLRITDSSEQCEDTLCDTILVKKNGCNAAFDWFYDDNSDSVFFINKSSKNTNSWLWKFGDKTSSTEFAPAHLFGADSVYEVCLKATDTSTGCQELTCKKIGGRKKCFAEFSMLMDTANYKVSFTNNSQGETLSYQWEFGDDSTSYEQNPVHTYTKKDTTYVVCLFVETASGHCKDKICTSIHFTKQQPPDTSGKTITVWRQSPLALINSKLYRSSEKEITLELDTKEKLTCEFQLFNILGQKVYTTTSQPAPKAGFYMTGYAVGIYTYKVLVNGEILAKGKALLY